MKKVSRLVSTAAGMVVVGSAVKQLLDAQKKLNRTGIIGAVQEEVALLKTEMEVTKTVTIAGLDFCVGTLNGKEVVVVQSGMGKVNAAACTQLLITVFRVQRIINTGAAGSLDAKLNIGDIVVSTELLQHDFDLTLLGYEQGSVFVDREAEIMADPSLVEAAVEATKKVAPNIGVYQGKICTGDQFIASQEQKESIISNFGGLCCEMEGGSVAQICAMNHIPFVVIRAISDQADDSGNQSYEQFQESVVRLSALITKEMMAYIDY